MRLSRRSGPCPVRSYGFVEEGVALRLIPIGRQVVPQRFQHIAHVTLGAEEVAQERIDAVSDLAVERLMGLIAAGDDLPEARVTLIDPDLIIRASTIGML